MKSLKFTRSHPLKSALWVALLILPVSAQASIGQWVDRAHIKADQTAAGLFGPSCKAKVGESPAQFQAREDQLFETSAQRLSDLDKCDVIRLRTLEKGGYQSTFIKTVVKDISVKLPTLRSLYREIEKLKSLITEMQKQNNAYDSQIARFGFLDPSQERERAELSKRITQKIEELKKPTAAYKVLFGTLWRNQDGAMIADLKSLIHSSISSNDYLAVALRPAPSIFVTVTRGNFSFLDKVVRPMIANESLFIKKIKAQYVQTPGGLKFEPNFATKKSLADNLDLLYDPAPTTDDYKELVCDIDQKYLSGDEDIDLTITGASFLIGPFGKAIPWALRLVKLEHLIEGSAAVARVGQVINSIPTAYWSLRTASGAIATCQSNYKRLQRDNKSCSADSSLEDAEDFDARELDASNCGLLILATAMNKTGVGVLGFWGSKVFASHPELVGYVQQIQKTTNSAIDIKNNGQNMIGNAGTAKDVVEKVTKDPKAKSPAAAEESDDSDSP
jgi:hypothetical protein